jgi:hypothetical protein
MKMEKELHPFFNLETGFRSLITSFSCHFTSGENAPFPQSTRKLMGCTAGLDTGEK